METNRESKSSRSRIIIMILLLLITISAVGITIFTLTQDHSQPTIAPDYAPQQVDSNADKMEETDESKLEAEEGGGAVGLTYSTAVSIDISDGTAAILFQNPPRSTQDMVLQLVVGEGDEETVLGESDLIPVGYSLSTMNVTEASRLSPGGYEGKFRVLYYNTETGEKAVVNTEIPVEITAVA